METSILISSTSFYLISSVFGKTMFVQSISDTSRKILNKIENGITYNNDVDMMYIDTDIVATMNTLNLLIKEINNINFSSSLKLTLNEALNNLNNIIIEIHDLLKNIEDKTEVYNTKYISYIKNINLDREINQVKKKNNILEKRLNLLIKILQINKLNDSPRPKISSDRRIIAYK